MKKGGIPKDYKLSKSDIKRLENVRFEWVYRKAGTHNFDARLKELMTFKNTFGHCNVSLSKSSDKKHYSVGRCTILWEDGPVVLERHMKS